MSSVKAHTEYLTFKTDERREMVHITAQVEEIVRRSEVVDGLCFVSPMHITAAIYVNDNEDGLIEDIGRGWRSWRQRGRDISTTGPGKTMGTRI
jgi:thiamine phosphate synthase YjbQ (UPF0047 family)